MIPWSITHFFITFKNCFQNLKVWFFLFWYFFLFLIIKKNYSIFYTLSIIINNSTFYLRIRKLISLACILSIDNNPSGKKDENKNIRKMTRPKSKRIFAMKIDIKSMNLFLWVLLSSAESIFQVRYTCYLENYISIWKIETIFHTDE